MKMLIFYPATIRLLGNLQKSCVPPYNGSTDISVIWLSDMNISSVQNYFFLLKEGKVGSEIRVTRFGIQIERN